MPIGLKPAPESLRRLLGDGIARAPVMALALCFAVTGAAMLLAQEAGIRASRLQFETSTAPVVRTVEAVIRNYTGLARVSSVLFDAAPGQSRSVAGRYIVGSVLSESYPAAELFAFVRWVPAADLAGYLKLRATSLAFDENGLPAAAVRVAPASDVHLLLEQVYPDDALGGLLGQDLASDPDAVAAMRRAEAARGVAILLQPASRLVADGIPVLVAPVYDPLAPAAGRPPIGFVLLKANFGSLISSALKDRVPAGYELRVGVVPAGASPEAEPVPLVTYGNYTSPKPRSEGFSARREIEFGVEKASILITAPSSAIVTQVSQLPMYTGLVGVLLSLLVWLAVTSLTGTRRRALEIAQQMTLAARHSDQRFRSLVESSRDWIWELDKDGRFTYTSPNCEDLLGYAPHEMLGLPYADFVLPSPGEADMGAAAAGAVPKAFQARLRTVRRKDGELRVMEGTGAPFHGPDGAYAGMRGIDRDVTARVRMRDRLADLQAQLETAGQFNLASQLLAGMAHELNQPLSAIALYNQSCVRMLERGDADMAEILKFMRASADKAAQAGEIIRRLRKFMAKREIKVVALPVGGPLLDALALVESQLQAQQVEIVTEIEPGLPAVHLDSVLILQVLLNLISNAVDAMRDSVQRVLHVRARRVAGQIAIEFLDTGEGVAPESRARLFDWYYTTKSQGMGLGLAISRSIVEAHEGNLTYEALPDGGSRFTIWLPIARQEEEAKRETATLH